MTDISQTSLRKETLEQILEVAKNLSSTFDVATILSEVADAARFILLADRVSFFMYDHDAGDLVLTAASRSPMVRIPVEHGIVGECATTRSIINVPDCYADPRFNRSIDEASGYRTQCLLSLPLVGFGDSLVGVIQLVNKRGGVFDDEDERVAGWLAAQCAVALQRVRLTESMVSTRKLDNEINVAREIQLGTLPRRMPALSGYEVAGQFKPTDQTGGDTYDVVTLDEHRLFMLLADATGHGIGPALSATQVRAMLRVALRLGADLKSTFQHINDQLVDDLPEGRYVTAFLGLLDARDHRVQFHSGGQGPILHYQRRQRRCVWLEPSTFPLGFMPQENLRDADEILLEPGDLLGLISDGVFEYENGEGTMFGMDGVAEVVKTNHDLPASGLIEALTAALADFGGEAPQFDDITVLLVRRSLQDANGDGVLDRPELGEGVPTAQWASETFDRSIDELPKLFDFAGRFIADNQLDPNLNRVLDMVLEELFTNLVKYNRTTDEGIDVELRRQGLAVVARIIDHDVERFDVTQAPEPDVDLPLESRTAGGLGLHLVRHMVDWMDYHYANRRSTITFCVSPRR